MHELSLAENVLQIIEESAVEQKFHRVRSVVLEIGKLSSVEPEAMRFCFDAVMRGTLADGAALQIVETPGAGCCQACGAGVEMVERYGVCPDCGSPRVQITSGNLMRVRDLTVE